MAYLYPSIQRLAADGTVQAAAHRAAGTWPWYVVRGSGFVAAGLLILLMLSGIGQVTGLTYRVLEPLKAWALHKAMAIALCASIALHVIFILVDHFVSFSFVQVLVPFLSRYSNHTRLLGFSLDSLGVGLGILAMYGVGIIVLSSLGWIDSRKRAWQWLHYLSYFVMLFVFIHSLGVGSDLRYGLFRTIWIVISGVLLLVIISRVVRAGSLRKSKAPPDDIEPGDSGA